MIFCIEFLLQSGLIVLDIQTRKNFLNKFENFNWFDIKKRVKYFYIVIIERRLKKFLSEKAILLVKLEV